MADAIDPERVLVLAPRGRDAALTRDLLARDGLTAYVCDHVESLCAAIEEGAGIALVAEEALDRNSLARLAHVLDAQPPWSDFPLLVFSAGATSRVRRIDHAQRALGNVTFLDRPVQVRSMLAAVHSAIHGRRRQYAARRAIEARDQFLAMLGHELRNPLAAIRLASELIGRTPDAEKREAHRAVIERQARHLARLVDDLLDVARVMYGKIALQRSTVDLRDLVESCVRAHEAAAKTHRLTLTFDKGDAPVHVSGDPVRLEQIVGNLLTNAIKYTPQGGSVRTEVFTEGASALVRVVDSGVGIAENMLPLVFDLFAQADRSLDRSQGGMGLGLTLVRNLVRLHGGEVEARSGGLGQGTELRVRLPLMTSVAPSKDEERASGVEDSPRRVVLVEDNEDIRFTLSQLLELLGHQVETAEDGPTGVEKILSTRPDVALVDIGLPGIDGFEVARRVRAKAGRDVVLVAVTGYGQAADRAKTREAGFDAHLTKPVGIEELETMLRARR